MAVEETPELVDFALKRLREAVKEPGVRVEKQNFPANGFLTYWTLRALDTWDALDLSSATPSLTWSQGELYRQIVGVRSN